MISTEMIMASWRSDWEGNVRLFSSSTNSTFFSWALVAYSTRIYAGISSKILGSSFINSTTPPDSGCFHFLYHSRSHTHILSASLNRNFTLNISKASRQYQEHKVNHTHLHQTTFSFTPISSSLAIPRSSLLTTIKSIKHTHTSHTHLFNSLSFPNQSRINQERPHLYQVLVHL